MELLILWRAIYKKRLLLVIVPIVMAVLAFLLASRFSKTYRSFTQLSTGFTLSESIDPDKQGGMIYFEIEAKFNNLRTNMGSPIVFGALSYQLGLHDLDHRNDPFKNLDEKAQERARGFNKDKIRKLLQRKHDSLQVLDLSNAGDQEAHELLKLYGYDQKSLERVINIYRVEASDYLRIEAGTNNPQLSAYIVNGLYKEFERYNTWQFSAQATRKLAQLAQLRNDAKAVYEEKSEALRLARRAGGVFSPETEGASASEEIQKLQSELREVRAQLTQDNYLLDAVNEKLARLGRGGAPVNNNNDRYFRLEEKITSLRRKANLATKPSQRQALEDSVEALIREQVNLRTGPTTDPSVAKERDQREQDLQDEKDRLIANVRTARSRISLLEDELSSQEGAKSFMSGKVSDFQKLQDEVDQAQKSYLEEQERYDKAKENVLSYSGVQQVILGQPAIEPESTKRMMFTALGAIGSFVLLFVWIILMELIDPTLKSPSVFAKQVRTRLLAAINFVDLEQLTPDMLFNEPLPYVGDSPQLKGPNQVHELPESVDVQIVASGINFDFFAKQKDKSSDKKRWPGMVFKEAIRRVRHELLQSGKKIFLVTSLRQADGKSTLVQYLAYALGRAGMRVLIIDGNFANNALTRWSPPRIWLENLAADNGEIPIGGGFGSPTPYPRIDIIGCRGGIYTPSEIMSPISTPNMMRYAREWYDVILIEMADMAAHTDTREMTGYVDSLICVASAEHGVNQKDKESLTYLNRQGEKFLGMVLNKVQTDNLPH
jgi:polysaccharide biosynthesis transport protein